MYYINLKKNGKIIGVLSLSEKPIVDFLIIDSIPSQSILGSGTIVNQTNYSAHG